MLQTAPAFAALRQWPQFVLYRLVPSKRKPGKMDKIPVAPFDRTHDENGINSQKAYWWVDMGTAIQCAKDLGQGYGVAFVITDKDPFFFLDMDGCIDGAGQWSQLALHLLQEFSGAAVEVSQSGTGLHVLGTASSAPDHGCKNEDLGIELYTKGRFIALTGDRAGGDILCDCTPSLHRVAQAFFPPSEFDRSDWTTEPRADWLGYTDDAELIDRACQSQGVGQVFGPGKATFRDLWEGNTDVLARCYPDSDRVYNGSQADAALAQHLAFWTGCNCDRIEHLMRQSDLYREKWDHHSSYLHLTITKACGQQKDVHQLKRLEPESAQPSATISNAAPVAAAPTDRPQPELVSGFQFLSVTEQLEHFAGCVYVQHNHAVLTPDGNMLKPDQFRATYGGYVFALDANNDKTTKNAWEAFVESQAIRHLKAHKAWFRPALPHGCITQEDGLSWVNTYVPIETPKAAGDVGPFLALLDKMLPIERDRQILLSFMAACVQFKGSKFQWSPLVQGAPGNGKSFLIECLRVAIGKRYSHLPRADEISEKYNDWIFNKLFIGVEEIYVPEHKRELLEVLKPMITASELEERAMQSGKVMKPLCANLMFNSNYRDAVQKTRDDRRFAIFYCTQQTEEDVNRDFPGDYFPNLYNWARSGGFAYVHEYLSSYAIQAEFNPALDYGGLANRAPVTSSTEDAILGSLGRVEQEILEAIDEQRPGFAGGWVSSTALDKLLEFCKADSRIPRNKRRDMMRSLGYDYHPAFRHNGGRATGNTSTDGNKPRLFIKTDHLARALQTGAEVITAYDKAQSKAAAPGDSLGAKAFQK